MAKQQVSFYCDEDFKRRVEFLAKKYDRSQNFIWSRIAEIGLKPIEKEGIKDV